MLRFLAILAPLNLGIFPLPIFYHASHPISFPPIPSFSFFLQNDPVCCYRTFPLHKIQIFDAWFYVLYELLEYVYENLENDMLYKRSTGG